MEYRKCKQITSDVHTFVNTSKVEIVIYFIIWIGSVIYALRAFARECKIFFGNFNDIYGDFVKDWKFLPLKDVADTEWEIIKYSLKRFYWWFIMYVILFEVLRTTKLSLLVIQYSHIFISTTFLLHSFGYVVTFIVAMQYGVFKITTSHQSVPLTWLCNILWLMLINLLKKEDLLNTYLNNDTHLMQLTFVMLGWINLRCTSVCLENNRKSFMEGLVYCLHLPTLFTGPFILYSEFEMIYQRNDMPKFKARVMNLFKNSLLCICWYTCIEICLHYVYVNATGFQPEFVDTMGFWSICGYGYAMGQFFHLKYVVLYGISTSIACFDNATVPSLPRCIGRVHLYSDMWKFFDPGLYSFLLRFIYVPLNKHVLNCNKVFASAVCFIFVYIWHGIETSIFIWALLNYIGIIAEHVGMKLYVKYFVGHMSETTTRRLKCFFAAPLLCMSAVSNFYFFGGTDVGQLFVHHLVEEPLLNLAALWFVLYCCCQVSTELSNVHARKAINTVKN